MFKDKYEELSARLYGLEVLNKKLTKIIDETLQTTRDLEDKIYLYELALRMSENKIYDLYSLMNDKQIFTEYFNKFNEENKFMTFGSVENKIKFKLLEDIEELDTKINKLSNELKEKQNDSK